jgi:hypothetical protein
VNGGPEKAVHVLKAGTRFFDRVGPQVIEAVQIAFSFLDGLLSRPGPLDPAPARVQEEGHGLSLEKLTRAGVGGLIHRDALDPQEVTVLLEKFQEIPPGVQGGVKFG